MRLDCRLTVFAATLALAVTGCAPVQARKPIDPLKQQEERAAFHRMRDGFLAADECKEKFAAGPQRDACTAEYEKKQHVLTDALWKACTQCAPEYECLSIHKSNIAALGGELARRRSPDVRPALSDEQARQMGLRPDDETYDFACSNTNASREAVAFSLFAGYLRDHDTDCDRSAAGAPQESCLTKFNKGLRVYSANYLAACMQCQPKERCTAIIEHNARSVRFFEALKRDANAKPPSAAQLAEFTRVVACEEEPEPLPEGASPRR